MHSLTKTSVYEGLQVTLKEHKLKRETNLYCTTSKVKFNPLNAELNPICHLLALLRAHHILHVSGLRVNKRIEQTQLYSPFHGNATGEANNRYCVAYRACW